MSSDARKRVEQLVLAARRIADPQDAIGRRARELLPIATGLSAQGVELALGRHLEIHPSNDEIEALIGGVSPAPRAHVLLSANVFVAAHRAIALALAQSPNVEVRASRREPEMARLLHEASGGAFRLVDELAPEPGDHVWAYGSDETLEIVRAKLPAGVTYHAHGHGFGVAVVQDAIGDLASDIIAFDQRGCLSPRLTLVIGGAEAVRALAQALSTELERLEHTIPRGTLDPDEAADIVRYRDTMLYAGSVLPAGKGYVGVDVAGDKVLVAPVGRNMQVVRVTSDLARVFAGLNPHVAALGYTGVNKEFLRQLVPNVRVSPLGTMQRPPFDGPADFRV